MSYTVRWYQIPEKIRKFKKLANVCLWHYVNPFYFKHEKKLIRVKQHRKYRHLNNINIQRGMDILIEPKTNGWLTY